MGFNSQTGQVGFGIQGVKGTPVAATRFARLRSGGLGGDRNFLIPDPEIGGNRDIPGAYLGPVAFNGDLEFYPRMEMVALLLKACAGASASSAVATANEVKTVTLTGVPTGGTFSLSFRGVTTDPIAFNATGAAVVAALVAASTAAGTGVFVAGDAAPTGGPLPAVVTLTFAQQYVGKNVPPLTLAVNALTGGTTPNVSLATTTEGLPAVGTHIITPADTSPWISVEERISNEFESFRYTDGKVNSFSLNADANGFLMGGANITALRQSSGFTEQTNAPWDTSPMMVGSQVIIKFNGVELPGKSFSFELNNNIETDDFVLGSVFRADATEKRREVKMGLTYRPQDALIWKGAMYGATALTSPGAGPAYGGAITISVSTYETIGDVVAGTPFSFNVSIPYAVIAPYKVNPSGDDTIQTDLEITATRPDPAVPLFTATVVDDLATVS